MSLTASQRWQVRRGRRVLLAGGIIAYPTEAVYGLGCLPDEPDAVLRILQLKARSPAKGLILIAAELSQLEPWLAPLTTTLLERVTPSWPGPVTWLLPAASSTPDLLTGGRETLAVRLTAHPIARALCAACDSALVSTSANPSGGRPARSALEVRRWFMGGIDLILPGPMGKNHRPTEIRDAVSGKVLRSG